jgi:hypothetical protein
VKVTFPNQSMWWIFALLVGLLVVLASQTSAADMKIAFTSDRDGNSEIYVMNTDGTNLVRLTKKSGIR